MMRVMWILVYLALPPAFYLGWSGSLGKEAQKATFDIITYVERVFVFLGVMLLLHIILTFLESLSPALRVAVTEIFRKRE